MMLWQWWITLLSTMMKIHYIGFLAAKITEYENNNERFAAFNKAVDDIPTGVAALRVLIHQYGLSYSDLKEEIGSKSLISQIFSGKRSLTIAHIKARAVSLMIQNN
ncbi:helix-turn-helix domain-containing protein [Photorhabdus sp. RW14-46]|uniref:helix-turn-helix domain-containing protein n=1 Tax=Photorhabdus sp. RW14-46 TaxID=2100168 RepID=UPI001F61C1DC|nr:helix-turn-helix domain-containing protein [Photorhabdus sp. RW14-46]